MERYLSQVQDVIPAGYDPRHVLAWMLIERPNLARMTPSRFTEECGNAMDCIDLVGTEVAERTAQRWSF